MADASGTRCTSCAVPRSAAALAPAGGRPALGRLSLRDRLSRAADGRPASGARDARRRRPWPAPCPADSRVSQWLAPQGQTRGCCDWLWIRWRIAALNQSPEIAAAAPFVRVVAELFGPRPEDAAVGLSRVPLDELYVEPAIGAHRSTPAATVHLEDASARARRGRRPRASGS